jgi:hypothetical protein
MKNTSLPFDVSFAAPVRADGSWFPEGYWIEVLIDDGERTLMPVFMRVDGDRLIFEHSSAEIVFEKVALADGQEPAMLYVGELRHPDFAYSFVEVSPVQDVAYDLMLGGDEAYLVGCHPFTHYQTAQGDPLPA